MNRVPIWDLPVRFFHWLLAAAFLAAFAIATLGDDEGALFPAHAILGIAIVFMVALRIAWGVIGSRWARFRSLDLRPSSLWRHLRGALGLAEGTPRAGHNPATSWFLLASIAILSGLAATGVLMARGNESVKDLHEVLAWSMLVLAGAHVAGVVWHRVRHRENLAVSMISGYKNAEAGAAIRSARPWSAVAFLLLTAAFTTRLVAGYDRASGRLRLPLMTGSLQLRDADSKHESRHPARQSGAEHERDEAETHED